MLILANFVILQKLVKIYFCVQIFLKYKAHLFFYSISRIDPVHLQYLPQSGNCDRELRQYVYCCSWDTNI